MKFLTKLRPDILCLQEIDTSETSLRQIAQFGYKLADFSNSFIKYGQIHGVATFYKPRVFSFNDAQSFDLSRSFYEFMRFIIRNNYSRRTVLKTELILRSTKTEATIYNLHLTPLATNTTRDRHIKNTFEDITKNKNGPTVIAGDFNYPYGRKKFEQVIQKYHLKEATNNIYFTHEATVFKIFPVKMKLDYILYKKIKLVSTEKIEVRHSDHYPILSYFEI